MSTERHFTASYDTLTKLMSGAVCIFVPALLGLLIQNVWPVVLACFVFGLCFAYSPLSYTVTADELIVRRLIGNIRIPRAGLSARRALPEDVRFAIRLWGSGGLFGYYGLFRTAKLGVSNWYVTHRRDLVIVNRSGGKPAVLSPDDVEGFLQTLPSAATPSAVQAPAAGGYAWLSVAGLLIGVAVAGLVVLAMSYAPGPPAYSIDHGALKIDDRFYPVEVPIHSIDLAQARVLDPQMRDREWQTNARTNGFANGHYRSGWFRTVSGRKVRLYQAENMALVLLPSAEPNGSPILISPADPQALLSDLRRASTK